MFTASAIHCDFRRSSPVQSGVSDDPAAVIAGILGLTDGELDFALAKVRFDLLVNPNFDPNAIHAQLDQLTETAWSLTHGCQQPEVRLGAVRRLLYEGGPWNDHRPFAYDQSDPSGRLVQNKLLGNYLRTRLGQCVSMPILFLILAHRLGLNVSLASAPEHVFVRYTDEAGRAHNLETTSGGHPARDAWYRETFEITDRAVESGIYLRSLTKREGIALMASTVLEHLNAQHRFNEVIDVAKVVLRHNHLEVHALLYLGTAASRLLDLLRAKHAGSGKVPPDASTRAAMLMNLNRTCFAKADQLGWVPMQ